jgi:hypothetical protein
MLSFGTVLLSLVGKQYFFLQENVNYILLFFIIE